MSTPKKPRKRTLRAAFVATVSVGAAVSGCGEEVITNPPFVECPNGVPSQGDPCDVEGSCSYTDDCSNTIEASCVDGAFEVEFLGTCNPPPPECPEAPPPVGNDCDPALDGPCSYELATACGPALVTASCDTSETGFGWTLDVPPCTPPTPACEEYLDAALCNADTTCRWLVPGCEDPAGADFAAGCYPIDDCDETSCALDQTCTNVSYDPCFQSSCGACGAAASICLASMDGA